MPEAGRTPTAQYERGDSLAYGEAGAANALMGLAAPVREPEPYTPVGDEEEFLYAETDRPAEPLTQGVPVGPGADFTKYAVETAEQFKLRVANALAAQQDAAPEVRAFLARIQRGE